MSFISILVYSLVVYRVTLLFTKESGPFNIFGKLRSIAGIPDDPREELPNKYFAQLLDCPACFSVMAAIVLFLLTSLFPGLLSIFPWIAAAAIALLIMENTKG